LQRGEWGDSKKEIFMAKAKEGLSEAKKYRVLYELKKDGKKYDPGQVIELTLTNAEKMQLIGNSLEEIKE
jgi:hypothetical protein